MFLGFVFIIAGLGLLMILEKIFPDRKLPNVPGWWMRVLAINISQLCIVVLGAYTWETWLNGFPSILTLKDYVSPALGGFIAYLTNSYIFYWFHRARHDIYLFWILFHQVHHSPQRIEVITSFYKHPLEILVDSVLMTFLLYPILGLSTESSIWLSIFSAYGEYFYHMNIRTPRWIGYFIQRPESHRVHHIRNQRENCKNYSDFPIWDILGDTFENPESDVVATGFSPANEARFSEMLMFKDVLVKDKDSIVKDEDKDKNDDDVKTSKCDHIRYSVLPFFLLLIGLLQPIGYLFNQPQIRGLGIISTASPLPLVFSAYNGVETYATSFNIDLYLTNNTKISIELSKSVYSGIEGPYNRRNVFDVLFSHGPFFNLPKLITLRNRVLGYAFCEGKLNLNRETIDQSLRGLNRETIDQLQSNLNYGVIDQLQYKVKVNNATITINSASQKKTWTMDIFCPAKNSSPPDNPFVKVKQL